MAGSTRAEVRIAALNALGVLGNASAVTILAEAAASGEKEEQSVAHLALVELRHGDVRKELLAKLPSTKPAIQAELARVLGDRGEVTAIPDLLQLAEAGS